MRIDVIERIKQTTTIEYGSEINDIMVDYVNDSLNLDYVVTIDMLECIWFDYASGDEKVCRMFPQVSREDKVGIVGAVEQYVKNFPFEEESDVEEKTQRIHVGISITDKNKWGE